MIELDETAVSFSKIPFHGTSPCIVIKIELDEVAV
jgi:hypothetical protein